MISFPNAKINLGLNVTSKREDGYHNISSCFLPIEWRDILEIVPSYQLEFTSSGLNIPGDSNSNLCTKAHELLACEYDVLPVKIHLHKVIPMGAGLGGGSADGAFTLKMLNQLFGLKLTNETLEIFAKKLGSDCPFFIQNRPKLVTGIGDVLENISIDISGYSVVVVFPGIHVNTKTAFSGIVPKESEEGIKGQLALPSSHWMHFKNDFEKSVFEMHPEIEKVKSVLLANGAFYASMTGTGSAVYGFFEEELNQNKMADLFAPYLIWIS